MIFIFISLFILSAVCAWKLSQWHTEQAKQAHVESYLSAKKDGRLTRLNRFITRLGRNHQQDLEQQFVDAGFYNTQFAKYYVPAKLTLVIFTCVVVIISDLSLMNKAAISAVAMITILLVPEMVLSMRKKALILKTSRQLPYMLDMMSVCVQTGMTIEAALTYLSIELEAFDKDLCFHIKKTADGARVKGLEKALIELSERIPTPDVRSFTLTLIQNLQYGTSIANVLSALAEDMRKMQVLTMEEKIGKLAAKMSVPLILLIMFPIVILILAPGMMQMTVDIGQ
ncbi:type II secretion system F family protein [Photobacterium profundum]|uniref:Hypothetical Flp pilus assembly protein TadC n=1 Tax=Photobacterium profundum 3TCK TaxID=314280 RepID=Q1Z422_9GAMM|nr:type II secretion system F family protein [Photobacterium profundum]EAS43280.1 hypothetical Flp pilus assembly protein TadC [Photobacterium profundum 3TCK]PSV61416.1 type II secretion system F family protein [Photobacterium profundum]